MIMCFCKMFTTAFYHLIRSITIKLCLLLHRDHWTDLQKFI